MGTLKKENAEIIEKYAKEYQDAFNSVTGSIRQKEEITDILKKLIPKATRIQVSNQIKRQKAARAVDESQKRLYVDIIAQVELRLVGTMETIKALLVDLQAQKNMQHLFAMLQGLIGFVSAVGGKDPMGVLSSSFSLIENEALRCNRGTLQQNKAKIKKWLKFGKAYEALEDSSDLNFDKMDIRSVPDMMKADLEINNEGLLADLVCLLDVDLPPHVTATFKSEIEKFFIDGGTRIDLIAQVMELDNNIGTYNYDIANLKETQKQIQAVNKAKDTPIADSIRQEFLDNLLNIYEELETSFSRQLYLFYKGFEFRSLWNMDEKMARFQRRAATLAKGTGYLQGVNSLNRALLEITNIEMAARSCFTSKKPKIGIYKWSFDKMKDPTMFKELYESYTTFTLDIDQACRDCYNVRLLKMYVELYGKAQDQSVPDKVRLKLKPLSRSYFRIGDQIKDFHQPIASWKYLHFDRFKITNKDKCRQEKEHGRDGGFYCMAKHDTRLTEMCCHPLISAPCDDALTGEEECRSVFGTYNISIPIDQTLDCRRQITYKNCKSLKRELFTHMNVWTTFMYWPETYPQTPEDCGIQKRNVTVEADVEELDSPLVLKRDADVN
ncbi:uncharacterized protein LOC113670461 [Pocillopora damicornis]|uniref:uncharacterized protein LOC113670461 n=1 Tax=Pocillopora damicornis TaxID=46731 RepID=UPI000F556B96|nr:uncharacterized protein LOC113670461 [Pocillopora damicornis]